MKSSEITKAIKIVVSNAYDLADTQLFRLILRYEITEAHGRHLTSLKSSSIRNFRFQSTTVRYQICLLADSPTARTHTHTPYNHQQHKVRFSKCHVMDMFPGRSFRRLGPLKSESVPVQLFSIPAQLSPIPASSLPLDSGRNPAARKWSENEPNRPEQTVPQQPGFARRVQYR
ncbi:unnamed protein product [Adineta ricciae]|uniref:Uncharacterized protein n=1 Tax=Adineta ricciae TaxID=249248 RepID=A0A814JUW8_ADIRI|nr:unnamed protein product [Adineta ricciae]